MLCRQTWLQPSGLQSSCSCCWWRCSVSHTHSNPRSSRSCWARRQSSTLTTPPSMTTAIAPSCIRGRNAGRSRGFPETRCVLIGLGVYPLILLNLVDRLTELLKTAAQSSKKDHVLPAVALDLLKLSLKEDSFQLFWNNTIINGMLREQPGPAQ